MASNESKTTMSSEDVFEDFERPTNCSVHQIAALFKGESKTENYDDFLKKYNEEEAAYRKKSNQFRKTAWSFSLSREDKATEYPSKTPKEASEGSSDQSLSMASRLPCLDSPPSGVEVTRALEVKANEPAAAKAAATVLQAWTRGVCTRRAEVARRANEEAREAARRANEEALGRTNGSGENDVRAAPMPLQDDLSRDYDANLDEGREDQSESFSFLNFFNCCGNFS